MQSFKSAPSKALVVIMLQNRLPWQHVPGDEEFFSEYRFDQRGSIGNTV